MHIEVTCHPAHNEEFFVYGGLSGGRIKVVLRGRAGEGTMDLWLTRSSLAHQRSVRQLAWEMGLIEGPNPDANKEALTAINELYVDYSKRMEAGKTPDRKA